MANIPSKATIKKTTIASMKSLGVHKSEYNRLIDVYSEMMYQYLFLTEKFIDGGYTLEAETGNGGVKKSPIFASLESLRKDILAYSDRLCLNPKAIESVTLEKPKTSALAEALKGLQ